MKETAQNGKLFLQFEQLNVPGVFHFTSTKTGWAEKARFTGDHPEEYRNSRKALAESLNVPSPQFVFPRQTHSNHIAIITESPGKTELANTDALVTNVSNLCLCVQTADCVPVLIYDPQKKVIAAIHAGWRGTVSQITAKTVQMMMEAFQCKPADMIAGIGPSISSQNYEVGADVIEAVKSTFGNYRDLLKPCGKTGKACFDLWKANTTLLENCGVPTKQIEVMGLCSFGLAETFYSARRDGTATGRMITGIMIL
jgi:YfiH family protein